MVVSPEITRQNHSIACSLHIYIGAVLRAHPVRGKSHIQRNATGKVVTTCTSVTGAITMNKRKLQGYKHHY